jgi:hypothetical protein
MVNAPISGTPGVFDPRNPTLIPNFDRNVSSGSGSLDHTSPALFLSENPRTDATAKVTIGGTFTAGDVATVRVAHGLLPNGYLEKSYTVVGGDTASVVADALAKAFNDDATAMAHGLYADVAAGALTFNWPSVIGNFAVLSGWAEAAALEITIGGTATATDTLNVRFAGGALASPVTVQATVTGAESTTDMATAVAAAITGDATLAAAGISATSALAVVTITSTVDSGAFTVLAWANGPAETGTVANMTATETVTIGTATAPAATDTVALTFTNAGVAGLPVTVTYTVQVADTVNTIAAGLAALINANATLAAGFITATSASAVITVKEPQAIGNSTVITDTITETGGGSETVTFGNGGHLSGGVGAVGNTVALTITNSLLTGSPITETHTVVAGDDATAVAVALKNLVNGNATLSAAGYAATNAAGVLSVTWPASAGPTAFSKTSAVITFTLAGGPTETATVSGTETETFTLDPVTGIFSGGDGPVIAFNNFTYGYNGVLQNYWIGQPYILDIGLVQAMINDGSPIA